MELPFWKNFINTAQKTPRSFIIIALTLIILGFVPLYHPSYVTYLLNHHLLYEKCDIFRGEWVPNPDAPYYTNTTCSEIYEFQNCMKNGRPDTGFMKWRWKPKGCELPIFNPHQFLDMMRNKSLAFVGDSVGRNQMQSLMCLLFQVEHPSISPTPDVNFKRWKYTSYNFTIATFWSPLLVKLNFDDHRHDGVFNIYLDEVNNNWTSQINEFNYIILNAGHWFNRLYYEKNQIVGCWRCSLKNATEFPVHYAYTMAFRTALKAINSLEKFKGITFVRTFAPAHFEDGEWNTGGDCLRKRPFTSNEIVLEGLNWEFYKSQVKEFWVNEKEGKIKGKKFRLLDVTQAMVLRPDGHPSKYGHLHPEKVEHKDCLHWCLPGPIDSWNDFLFHMLKIEQEEIGRSKSISYGFGRTQ